MTKHWHFLCANVCYSCIMKSMNIWVSKLSAQYLIFDKFKLQTKLKIVHLRTECARARLPLYILLHSASEWAHKSAIVVFSTLCLFDRFIQTRIRIESTFTTLNFIWRIYNGSEAARDRILVGRQFLWLIFFFHAADKYYFFPSSLDLWYILPDNMSFDVKM